MTIAVLAWSDVFLRTDPTWEALRILLLPDVVRQFKWMFGLYMQ